MKKNKIFYSYSIPDTERIAKFISEKLISKSCVYISGDVGSGKTYLSKFIANNFEVNDLNSATYSKVSTFKGSLNIIHCDFYNIKPDQTFIESEILPNLIYPWLFIVEWPHVVYEIEFNQLVSIKLEVIGKYARMISFTTFTQ